MCDYLLINGFVYIKGQYRKLNVGITGEKITYIGKGFPEAKQTIDVYHNRILPGIIDPHVHLDLSVGEFISRDNFESGSKSAIYGGVTTIVDFLEPTKNAKELENSYNKRLLEARKSKVDYHFHACLVEPDGDLKEYVVKMKELGINTVKVFTTYSESNRMISLKTIEQLLKLSCKYKFTVLAHIEDDSLIKHDKGLTYKDLSIARSSKAENDEALKLAALAVKTKGRLYMVHCSSGISLANIVKQYRKYINKYIFIESCPQYFAFTDNYLTKPYGYLFTFAPSLRSEKERQLLCKYFDYIYAIGTDHCPFNVKDKKSHLLLENHPLGVGGIESSFLTMYEMFGERAIDKMTSNVAQILRFKNKGEIKVNNFADLFIMSSDPQLVGKPHGSSDYSIYQGMHLSNQIVATMVHGQFALYDNNFKSTKGKLINSEMKKL